MTWFKGKYETVYNLNNILSLDFIEAGDKENCGLWEEAKERIGLDGAIVGNLDKQSRNEIVLMKGPELEMKHYDAFCTFLGQRYFTIDDVINLCKE